MDMQICMNHFVTGSLDENCFLIKAGTFRSTFPLARTSRAELRTDSIQIPRSLIVKPVVNSKILITYFCYHLPP